MTLPQLLRPEDVCERLAVSRSWLYDAAKRGVIPHRRLGGQDGPLRFDPDQLAEWLKQEGHTHGPR